MISDYLPSYLASREGTNYRILESIMINGHEVAWMEASGIIKYDLMQQGREGLPWTDRRLYCECHFRPDVDADKCTNFDQALVLRIAELRAEYQEKLAPVEDHIPEIVLDLMEKAKAGEFIGEGGAGARFYGGYFYANTVESIVGSMGVCEIVRGMVANHQICMDGFVIQPYTAPPPDAWDEYTRIESGGWTMVVSLPAHDRMACEWKFELLKPDATPSDKNIPGLRLNYEPTFGPDQEDVAAAQQRVSEIFASLPKD